MSISEDVKTVTSGKLSVRLDFDSNKEREEALPPLCLEVLGTASAHYWSQIWKRLMAKGGNYKKQKWHSA